MNDTFPNSWRDPRYLDTVVVLGTLFFYAGLTHGPPTPESIAILAFVISVVAWLGEYLWDRTR